MELQETLILISYSDLKRIANKIYIELKRDQPKHGDSNYLTWEKDRDDFIRRIIWDYSEYFTQHNLKINLSQNK